MKLKLILILLSLPLIVKSKENDIELSPKPLVHNFISEELTYVEDRKHGVVCYIYRNYYKSLKSLSCVKVR